MLQVGVVMVLSTATTTTMTTTMMPPVWLSQANLLHRARPKNLQVLFFAQRVTFPFNTEYFIARLSLCPISCRHSVSAISLFRDLSISYLHWHETSRTELRKVDHLEHFFFSHHLKGKKNAPWNKERTITITKHQFWSSTCAREIKDLVWFQWYEIQVFWFLRM